MKKLNRKQVKTYQIDSLKCRIHLLCAAAAVVFLMFVGSDAKAMITTDCVDYGNGMVSCTTNNTDFDNSIRDRTYCGLDCVR